MYNKMCLKVMNVETLYIVMYVMFESLSSSTPASFDKKVRLQVTLVAQCYDCSSFTYLFPNLCVDQLKICYEQ